MLSGHKACCWREIRCAFGAKRPHGQKSVWRTKRAARGKSGKADVAYYSCCGHGAITFQWHAGVSNAAQGERTALLPI
jgi:hypothetical protein